MSEIKTNEIVDNENIDKEESTEIQTSENEQNAQEKLNTDAQTQDKSLEIAEQEKKPKNKKKKWIIIVTATVLAVAIGVGSWFGIPKIMDIIRKNEFTEIVSTYSKNKHFKSEEEMKNYLKGTWIEKKELRTSEDNKWTNIDSDKATSYFFTAKNYFQLYALGNQFYEDLGDQMLRAVGTNEGFWEKTAEEYLAYQYESRKLRFDYKQGIAFYDSDSDVRFNILEDGSIGYLLSGSYTILEKVPDGYGFEERYNELKNKIFGVPDEEIVRAMLNRNYYINSFSMPFETLLRKLCTNSTYNIVPYDEGIEQFPDFSDIDIENYKGYFITVIGRVLYNPQIPNYYSDTKDLFTLLILFNDNNEYVHSYTHASYVDDDFHTAATLCIFNY